MDKKPLQCTLDRRAAAIWNKLTRIHSELARFDVPTIKLNGRLYRTAGRCYQETGIVELGTKFFFREPEYMVTMLDVILPHEIIHRADFVLYGQSEMKCGHGRNWRRLMVQYGLEPNPYHTMWITR